MENNKLATLITTSILTILTTNTTSFSQEITDSNIHESISKLGNEARTCNQCNMPRPNPY